MKKSKLLVAVELKQQITNSLGSGN